MFRDREIELAWAAGLFDGEGSICIAANRTNGDRSKIQHRLFVRLGMTNKACVDKFSSIIGFGKVYERKKRLPLKMQWEWVVADRAACRALLVFMEYLVLKKPEAEVSVAFALEKSSRNHAGIKVSPELFAKRESVRRTLQEMKRV